MIVDRNVNLKIIEKTKFEKRNGFGLSTRRANGQSVQRTVSVWRAADSSGLIRLGQKPWRVAAVASLGSCGWLAKGLGRGRIGSSQGDRGEPKQSKESFRGRPAC